MPNNNFSLGIVGIGKVGTATVKLLEKEIDNVLFNYIHNYLVFTYTFFVKT